jgi:hypothetical protein
MGGPDQLGYSCHSMRPAPPVDLCQHLCGRTRVGEGGRADLDRTGSGEYQLDSFGTPRNSADADD